MLQWLKPKHCSILAMELNSTSVKFLEVSYLGTKPCLLAYGVVPMPAGAIESHLIKDSFAVVNCIKQIFKTHSFSNKAVLLALPDSAIISKIIKISANLKHSEREAVVRLEAANFLSYPLDEINLDFEILDYCRQEPNMLEVLIVATRKENIDQRITLLKEAGLRANVIEPETQALERIFSYFPNAEDAYHLNKVITLIIVSTSLIKFFIFQSDKLIFSAEESTAAEFIADAEKDNSCSFIELMHVKINRLLQLFFSSPAQQKIDQFYLAGEMPNLIALAQMIEEQIVVPTSVFNPFHSLELSIELKNDKQLAILAPSFVLVAGLALRKGKII